MQKCAMRIQCAIRRACRLVSDTDRPPPPLCKYYISRAYARVARATAWTITAHNQAHSIAVHLLTCNTGWRQRPRCICSPPP
eukprot:scaffold7131_cov131-Isochrysis_galbana.AAC.4